VIYIIYICSYICIYYNLFRVESPVLLFNDWSEFDQLMDEEAYNSDIFQRPYQYLKRFSTGERLEGGTLHATEGAQAECLQCLLR